MEAQPAPVLAVWDGEVELGTLLAPPSETILAVCPDAQDGVDVLVGHPPVRAVLWYLERDRITREGPPAATPQQAPLTHAIKPGDARDERPRMAVGAAAT